MVSRSAGWVPARRNIVALFGDMKKARAAISSLEAHGFDAGSISLEGPRAARATERTDTRRRDARVPRYIGARAGAGIVIGALLGGGIGLIVAAAVGASGGAVAIAAVAGLMVGGTIGMMIGGVGSIDVTPDWELTFEREQDGDVAVAVGSDDPAAVERAVDVLEHLEPISVRQVDAQGRPI